ncbi:Lrp/AsnC family transcriptional regulator [Candidatus Micrarchaeota archaeon]|nr:Lrp/AsnC family transcriptional regulator [Candidatus Micrarchaeota archaeon]
MVKKNIKPAQKPKTLPKANPKKKNYLDKLDSRIIESIVKDPRISIKKLARSAGCSEQVASYRLNRLISRGIIGMLNAVVNMNYLGFEHYRIFFKLKKVDPDSIRKVCEFFESCWGVYNVTTLGGKYDLFVNVFVRNYLDYDDFIDSCYTHFPEIIGEIDDVYVKNYYIYPFKHMLPEGQGIGKAISIPVSYKTVTIDEIDKQILDNLSSNCRLTSVDLSNIIRVNYKTILYRIKGLEEKNIIKGYHVFVDDKVYKQYFVVFSLGSYYKETETKIFNYLSVHPLICSATKQFGKWQLMVTVNARDENEVKAFIINFREQFKNVRDYEVLPVTKTYYVNMFPHY